MAIETHPASETLAAFSRGDLPQTELSAVAEHVAVCPACLASLQGLPEDSLANLARAAARPSAAGVTAFDKPVLPDSIPEALANHPRYKILNELGAGGMGVVYKAEDQIMGRMVALKVMTPHLTAKANAVERFRKEVRAAAQLLHPNIVTAHDAGEAGGRHFLVMEYVEGQSLDRYVARKGPLRVSLAALFTCQAAIGLQHASEKGMVHRDIKPQNLMITRKRHLKIMDFGLARFASTDADEPEPTGRLPFGAAKPVVDAFTNPNLLLGTPDYLSPEQARNSHTVDTRSDVYSLGCTLYFLLTGKPPFGREVSLIDKLLAHTQQQPPPVRELRPEVPEGLAAVLAKMMAKKPADRYTTPGDAAEALEPFARRDKSSPSDAGTGVGFEVNNAVIATPISVEVPRPVRAAMTRVDTPAAATELTLAESVRPRRKAKKVIVPWWKRKWTAIAAAAACGLLIAAAIVANGGKKKEETPDDNTGTVTVTPTVQPKSKGNSNPGTSGGKANDSKVLFVVPSAGVYGPDYHPVGRRLIDSGAKVVTASSRGEPASLTQEPTKTIPVNVKLSDVVASDYSAVIFCGFSTDEYVTVRDTAFVAKELIKSFQDQKKPVAAICVGQRVLLTHGVLNGKSAAKSPALAQYYAGIARDPKVNWEDKGVVVSGNVITAAGPDDATEFADAILKAIKPD